MVTVIRSIGDVEERVRMLALGAWGVRPVGVGAGPPGRRFVVDTRAGRCVEEGGRWRASSLWMVPNTVPMMALVTCWTIASCCVAEEDMSLS